MITFFFKKFRTLRWFIFLAVFFSTFIVFLGVSAISSLLYENLMAEQASYLTEQLMAQTPETRAKIDLPSITTEVRLAYVSTFVLYSLVFIFIAFIFSHFAIRRINQSIEQFSQQINQIQTGQDLQNFNPNRLNFIFSELNQAFNSISELARQLGRVLNDKNILEIKTKLLSKLVIKNTHLNSWNEYISSVFIDIYNTLPFEYLAVYLTENNQPKVKIFWYGEVDQLTEEKTEQLLSQQINKDAPIQFIHQSLTHQPLINFKPELNLLVHHFENEPQIGCVQGVFIQSPAMLDVALRLRISSILVVLLNLLGSSRAISGYTQQLETAINLSEQENAMAAEVLYGHLLVKNTDLLKGVNYQICSSSRFSGDIIQVKRSPSGSTFILVADATGHGLSATITVMPVIAVFNAMVQKGYQLAFILSEMNKHLVRDLPDDRFVAAVLVEIDPTFNEVSIWNGGMPSVLQFNSQGELVDKFRSKHMALGILDDQLFDTATDRLKLPQDGHLMVYSDGLIEQENPAKQGYGSQQLISQLSQHLNNNPIKEVIQAVLNYAELEQPDDDISLCQIDFASLASEIEPQDVRSLVCKSITTPFEWQMKIYGSQIAKQSLPALCNEFMQAQSLSQPLKRWSFSIIHELVQKVTEANLQEGINDTVYLQLKFQCHVKDCDALPEDSTRSCLVIEVSDNATGPSNLMEEASLANIRSLADQVTVSQQGHNIQVRLG